MTANGVSSERLQQIINQQIHDLLTPPKNWRKAISIWQVPEDATTRFRFRQCSKVYVRIRDDVEPLVIMEVSTHQKYIMMCTNAFVLRMDKER